ncbi:unnamed protein product, partial [Leptidea sinapis]
MVRQGVSGVVARHQLYWGTLCLNHTLSSQNQTAPPHLVLTKNGSIRNAQTTSRRRAEPIANRLNAMASNDEEVSSSLCSHTTNNLTPLQSNNLDIHHMHVYSQEYDVAANMAGVCIGEQDVDEPDADGPDADAPGVGAPGAGAPDAGAPDVDAQDVDALDADAPGAACVPISA